MLENLGPTFRYVWLTIKHKWFVLVAGIQTNTPLWQLIVHDMSKFSRAEAPHYGRQFFGKGDKPYSFARAWLHHIHHNPHHWEYWISASGHTKGGFPDNCALPMPMIYVREMVADWLGASRAYGGKWPETWRDWTWFNGNWSKVALRMHPMTIQRVERVLQELWPKRMACYACDGDTLLHWPSGGVCYELDCPVCVRTARIKPGPTVEGDPLPTPTKAAA